MADNRIWVAVKLMRLCTAAVLFCLDGNFKVHFWAPSVGITLASMWPSNVPEFENCQLL